ncbi:VOC family protein [Frondihabitans cladoniiphilus]|uniref:VOC family protein n=1 Tax=Frondihabitans cladoniiphilus TaxID=715785 RepID=A0ABP8W2I0_9MICO
MPAPLTFPTGAPIWIELNTSDVPAAKRFYEGLFGWTTTDTGPDFGNYVTLDLEGAAVGGMMPQQAPGVPDAWTVYLHSSDVATTATAIRDAEGDVLMGPQDVMEMGRMLVAADADRGIVAAWEPGTNPGLGVIAEVGAPAWFELHTTQFHREVEFYQQAFGWQTATMADTPEFRYAQLLVDGQPYAGVMDASAYWAPGAPAAWLVYFLVADADAALARAVELGGAVVDEPADTPYGRLATLSDPTGALLKVMQSL